jgi:putative heme-binding domain-containing protein
MKTLRVFSQWCTPAVLAGVWLAAGPRIALAVEPWADPELPVTSHLELWLDASRQIAVRQAQGPRWLSEGAPVDRWFDGSGWRRDAVQWVRESMPQFRTGGGVAWARFDGRDDYLAIETGGLSLTNFTVFIVANPRSNPGFFSALLACSESGRNDYTHGFNIDLGPLAGPRFDWLNVEAAGASGAFNFIQHPEVFGTLRISSIMADDAAGVLRTWVDADAEGAVHRPWNPSRIRASQVFVGARFYSNTADPASVRGFLDGDVAEVLLYRGALGDEAHQTVMAYLKRKYARLKAEAGLAAQTLNPLVPVANPPAVQVLVPGFEVTELPIELPNLNGVKYRPDGQLMALGYNGRLYLLSDSDDDEREDRVRVFWEGDSLRAPIGMALTPSGYALGTGAFVAAKGRLSLIVDTDNDDRADREIIVAQGWRELPHGVDALGVAVDHEGNVYFGLGATDFTNAYLVDAATGRARYRLDDERGTILKVSPDFSRREIVATGIRFSVALAFNSAGDLFCTDQEGATWLPNGNPLDELLHIQRGRHYGFPPRHPRHLPQVIDEPSTFDYSPQHQSVCGLNFNDPVNGGPPFGPAWWKGDAIVSGYSRGKLYRTALVKTAAGYVASSQLFACLTGLTVDACVSSRGDLVVATHSGQPDWGSGPNGMGKLYRIRYAPRDVPQPRLVWAVNPTETCIAWDRPLSAEQARAIVREAAAAGGRHLAAGDRFEMMRPGYQVVQDQLGAPRRALAVQGAQLSADGYSLRILTEPRDEAVNYLVTLQSPASANETANPALVEQEKAIDLAYSLQGVEAAWKGHTDARAWHGWLPSLDLEVSDALTAGVATHEGWREALRENGEVVLRAYLDLWQMLRPAVQPGSELDYSLPPEEVELCFRSDRAFSLHVDGKEAAPSGRRPHEVIVRHAPRRDRWLRVEATIRTPAEPSKFHLAWRTAEDSRERPMALHRMLLPWAIPPGADPAAPADRLMPELAGADWLNGRRVFFSEAASCSRCHQLRGEGERVGPDLSNLVHRDYGSVLQDILQPNASLNPDHIAYDVELTDGEVLGGVLQKNLTNAVILAMANSPQVRVPREHIALMKPASLSLMPEGLAQGLGEKALHDLMAFLLLAPLNPAPLQTDIPQGAVRLRAEVEGLFSSVSPPAATEPVIDVLLVAGPKDHGPDEHDYPLWQERWGKLLALAPGVRAATAEEWPSPSQLRDAEVVVFYSNNPGWSRERAAELKEFHERGGGLVYIHFAVDGHKDVEVLTDLIGLAWRGGASKFRHGPLLLKFKDPGHPITRGFGNLELHDESYWDLVGDPASIRVLAAGLEEGAERPLIWTREHGAGRVFVSIPGHYTWTFDDPAFRLLLLRGICWAAKVPEDRLSELARVGARMSDRN